MDLETANAIWGLVEPYIPSEMDKKAVAMGLVSMAPGVPSNAQEYLNRDKSDPE